MTFSEETLMAYADGELDASTRAAIEAAMATDPVIARRIEQYRRLRETLHTAYDEVLDAPVPDRLLSAVRNSNAPSPEGVRRPSRPGPVASSDITDLAQARAAKAKPAGAEGNKVRWSWPEWGAVAASLVVGALLAQMVMRGPGAEPIAAHEGRLLAQGTLNRALSNRLAAEPSDGSEVQIGLSFRDRSGEYCRTFAFRDRGLSGLACREGEAWHVQVLSQGEAPPPDAEYRTASSPLSPLILQAVEARIAGEPLDAQGEAAARERDWR